MTMIRRSALFFLISLLSQCHELVEGGAVQLTLDNFAEKVEGKNVFIKFYAPWCGHCRAMAEDWDKLAEEYAGHPVALIGEVDCTSDEGHPVCEDFEVQGFPTLVFGDPMNAETYDGARDYETLSAFANDHITKPLCNLQRLANCSDEEKALIDQLMTKPTPELEGIVTEIEGKVSEIEKVFDAKVASIQQQYDVMVAQFNKELDALKEEYNYKFVEQILTLRHEESGGDNVDFTDSEL